MLLYCIIMAWYDDLWSGIKSVVSVGKDVVNTVLPILPFILKKGGRVEEFKDTPANRAKILKAFNKMNKSNHTMKFIMKKLEMMTGKKNKK